MPKIKIDTEYARSKFYSQYGASVSKVSFAFVNKVGPKRIQVTRIHGCRDYLHEDVRDSIRNKNIPPIDTDRLRLLVLTNIEDVELYRKNLFTAKKVLAMYEKMAGWKNRSKIATVGNDLSSHVWLITGPKEWMSSPHLISMATLILRVGINSGPLPSSEKEIVKKWKEISNSKTFMYDGLYISECYKYFPILMKNYNQLFTLEQLEAFAVGHGNGGIVSLCQGKSPISKLNTNLQKLYRRT